ncbi:MAG: GTPase Era [Melioribacteraceae bacterium]|nr:GTPase Era [Melioribacteraceae bacterium]MCF8265260.1 GTPase Era [Melioribacteraceae bacterium]MCF8414170.1 GTPase Era [Melioribacteraceae bacterium]MCF8432535.1 GTPase Era [Melioribacteraceae bacterium]
MNTKAGFVGLIGLPNAGKSTLMNRLLGEKLSIVTKKPQTTRKRILGILSEEDYQIVFLDTPGLMEPKYLLQKTMRNYVEQSVLDADILLYVFDISMPNCTERLLSDPIVKKASSANNLVRIAIINKIDLSSSELVKDVYEKIEATNIFSEVLTISAKENFNIKPILDSLINSLPESPKYFPDDQISDETERFHVSEIIREKIFGFYKEEIPYSVEVEIEEFNERENRKDFIRAAIIVERDSQKSIIIGKKGEMIKKVGSVSREEIEEFIQRPVYLELVVKVRPKWRSDARQLSRFGYLNSDA